MLQTKVTSQAGESDSDVAVEAAPVGQTPTTKAAAPAAAKPAAAPAGAAPSKPVAPSTKPAAPSKPAATPAAKGKGVPTKPAAPKVAPAPAPPPAPPQAKGGKVGSPSSNKTTHNHSVAPAPVPATTRAPSPPYGSPSNKDVQMLQPLKNLTATQKAALKARRAKALLDCLVETWSPWSECRRSQNNGYHAPYKTRERVIIQPKKPGGADCPSPLTESQLCNVR
jgi:hypothetical protein